MRNHFEEYYRSLQRRDGLRNAIIIALLLHVGLIGSIGWYVTHKPPRPEAMSVGIYVVPGEVKDPNKPTSVAAPPPRSGEVAPPQPAPKKEEPPKPEPKKEEPPKPEPKKEEPPKPEEKKPEPKKEEPKKEEKKEEPKPKPKTEPKPKKEEEKKKEEKKKEEPKKEEKKTEPKKEDPKKTEPKKEEKKPVIKESEPSDEEPKKTEAPKKTAVKPTTGKTVDPEMDMIMGDVAEFSNETNPNGLEGPVTIQPGDMAALGLWPSRVKSQVDRTWKLPSGVSMDSTPCTLGFSVDREGKIVGTVEIIVDSDNPAITESALQALENATFPPLPDSYEKPTVYVEYHFTIIPQ